MLDRAILPDLKKDLLNLQKIILLFGARQVGKTTIIREIIKGLPHKCIEINADQHKYIQAFSQRDYGKMIEVVGSNELLFIDEAQNIPDIGINLKILHDNNPSLKIIATGSSSFDLAHKTIEPLTGRTRTYKLFPISMGELKSVMTPFELKQQLNSLLVFGMYPDILHSGSREEKIRNLKELAQAYLYKDITQLADIKYPNKLHQLMKHLALKMGELISHNELGQILGLSRETVSRYIDMLEKGFLVFQLPAYSKFGKTEVDKSYKVYFYDLGIRNVLIENFNDLNSRNDTAQLWESFLITERLKKKTYENAFFTPHFWRTYSGTQMDYVEKENGMLNGFRFSWKPRNLRAPKSWTENYPNSTYRVIGRDDFLEFVL